MACAAPCRELRASDDDHRAEAGGRWSVSLAALIDALAALAVDDYLREEPQQDAESSPDGSQRPATESDREAA